MRDSPAAVLVDADGHPVSIIYEDSIYRLDVRSKALEGGVIGSDVPSRAMFAGGKSPTGKLRGFLVAEDGTLKVVTTVVGEPLRVFSIGNLAAGATAMYEYTVPSGKTLKPSGFFVGGEGTLRGSLIQHVASAVAFVLNGDFESAGEVTPWAAVSGAFTSPSPDSNGTQFVTGAASMRWIYTASATAHTRRQTFAAPVDFSGYRYVRVRFFNDANTGTTRTLSMILTSGTATRTYSLAGTLGTAPFTANTWVTLECDLENPTSSAGTAFNITQVNAIALSFIDGANKAGTIYWDTVRFEDSLTPLYQIYSPTAETVAVPTAPESIAAGTTLYMRTKNIGNVVSEYGTFLVGSLETP